MEKIIEYFAANPVHLAIALVLAFIVLFSFVKKLLKLGLVIVAIFIIYIAFLIYTGQEFDPDQFDEVGKKAKEMINNNIISGGMIPKINNCLDVASNGVKGVVIIDGRKPHSILFELFSDKGAGTLIRE